MSNKFHSVPAPGQGKDSSSAKAPAIRIVRLTKAQEQLLETLRDPAVVGLSVAKICKLANITKGTYYAAFNNDQFVQTLEVELQKYRRANEFPVMHNVVKNATEGKNFHWAQMFLQMQGRLHQGQSKPAIIQVNFNVERPSAKTDMKVIDAEVTEVDN